MNKATVHPYLIARLRAVQNAFTQPVLRPAFSANIAQNIAVAPKKANNWNDIVKKEDEEGEGGTGGRGTIKGLRQKDSDNLKNAMRKLSRK